MTYTKQTWSDGDTTKPVSAARMQHIEDGLDAVANGGSIASVGGYAVPGFGELPSNTLALRTFRAALARRAFAPCNVLVIGTSLSEGAYLASASPAGTYVNRWQDVLRDTLRTRYPVSGLAGGYGFLPPQWGVSQVTPAPATLTGGSTNFGYGIGRRATTLAASAGNKCVWTKPCTGVDLFWVGSPSAGHFTWKVDAGATTDVDTFKSAVTDGNVTQIRSLDGSSHAITFAWASGGPVIPAGAMFYNGDESKGIRFWDGSHSSQSSAYWVDPPNEGWWANIPLISPDLVIYEGWVNDAYQGLSGAATSANIKALIAEIKTACSPKVPSFVLASTYPRGDLANGTYAANYNAARAVAVDDPANVCFFDFAARSYTSEADTASDALGILYSDHIHFNVEGQQMFADALLSFIAP